MALKKHFFFTLILSLCFAACSSDDDGVKPADDQGDGGSDGNGNSVKLTFTKLVTGTDRALYSIHFLDDEVGFMAGGAASVYEDDAIVLKSIDGGKTWAEVYTEDGFYITALTSLTDQVLFATTSDGAILKSKNAGVTWEKISIQSGIYWSGIRFIDAQVGFLVGSTSAGNGELFITADGGESWESIINTKPLENNPLREISIIDNKTVLVSGGTWDNGTVLKTTNKGIDWKVINVSEGVKIRDIAMNGNEGYAIGDNGQFNAETEKGMLFKTADGGETWESVETDYDNRLLDLAVKGNIGCVAGFNKSNNLTDPEFLMMSFDGGEKWSRINHDFGLTSWGDVEFVTESKLIVSGHDGLAIMIEVSE